MTTLQRKDALHIRTTPDHAGLGRHLVALGRFLAEHAPDPTIFFDQALALLVDQLRVDRAMVVRLADLGFEPVWWATSGHAPEAGWVNPDVSFCPRVLEHPNRLLVIRDAAVDPECRHHPAYTEMGVRAFLGMAIWQSGRPMGILSLQERSPRRFTRAEISLVSIMASLIGRAMEVEQLRYDLRVTKDALDLATAIVEDSAVESSVSGLPNALYLDIWLKANLYLARRRGDSVVIVTWQQDLGRRSMAALRELAEAMRGEDLVVDLGRGHFLMLLPRTDQEGAGRPLERLRAVTGDVPMGATLWNPAHSDDALDVAMHRARARAAEALALSRQEGGAALRWILPHQS